MENQEENQDITDNYFNKPSLVLRVKSIMIDSLVVILLMYLTSIFLDILNVESGKIRGLCLVFILLYEPILVAISRTVGQKVMGLRLRNYNNLIELNKKTNINILSSMIRFIGKITLGWISLLTIHSNVYGQAIHDIIGNSIMTIEK